jgi:hypothetical protein
LKWGYLASAGTLDPNTSYWSDGYTAAQSVKLGLSGTDRTPSSTRDSDGDGVVDSEDADPLDPVVDWPPAAEAPYVVIELEQENYDGYSGCYGSRIDGARASISQSGSVLWKDPIKTTLNDGSDSWYESRSRVWKGGTWSLDLTRPPTEFESYDAQVPTNVTVSSYIPGNWSSGGMPQALCGEFVVGKGCYSGSNSHDSVWFNNVAMRWESQDATGQDAWYAEPLAQQIVPRDSWHPAPPIQLSEEAQYLQNSMESVASPGGALAILGGEETIVGGRQWEIWSPPAVPGTEPYSPGEGTPTWEKSYEEEYENILEITAIEDGGSVVGERGDNSIAIDNGMETVLPGSTGSSVKALCRVSFTRDGTLQSRLVAAGSDLWVKKGGIWKMATHSPTVSPVIAVAADGVLLGSQSIWRNGREIPLDKLAADLKVAGPGSAPRYTNLSARAMNSDGTIVALADDVLNPGGQGHKTLILLSPIKITNLADPAKGHNNRDTNVAFKKDDNDTSTNCVSWIAAHDPSNGDAPRMPKLVAKAGSIPGLTYCWKLQVTFHDRLGNNHRDFDTGSVQDTPVPDDTVTVPHTDPNSNDPDDGWWEITDGSPCNIYLYPDWVSEASKGFFGGDAVLSLKIKDSNGNVIVPQQDYKFRIAGENPDPDKAKTFINSVAGTQFWYAYAIARHETYGEGGRTYYNHFLDQGGKYQKVPGKEGKPNWNDDTYKDKQGVWHHASGSGGYGLFQLTYDSADSRFIEPRKWIWNWRDNTRQAIAELQEKVTPSQDLYNGLQATYPASGSIPNHLSFSGLEAIIVTCYNGMSGGQIKYKLLNGHKKRQATCWDPIQGGWNFLPNRNNYVDEVNSYIEH